ncbi:Tex family protein [Lachnoclostridium sp. Marseille-P6806]|uniref:Tex family protein n=1 Tax=Lachnoclostridium sp. Marseille-P6806 TaxID=2364793 RepID=UPI0010303DFE|nr:Tex family protein [Lachnoclostridium sp. Marseille-P6806]
MNIIRTIAEQLGIRQGQAEAAVRLIDEGNTIPFIARYRKEQTGALDDEQLRALHEKLLYLRGVEERRAAVLASIEEQGKLTGELRAQLEAAETLVAVEDIYRPFRPKRRTRAGIARERGLQPLADYILEQTASEPLEKTAAEFVLRMKEIPPEDAEESAAEALTAEEALAGARDIIAEMISDNADYRAWIREKTWAEGTLASEEKTEKAAKAEKTGKAEKTAGGGTAVNKKLADRRAVYEMYFHFEEALRTLPGHRILAVNRGENEKFLTVRVLAPAEEILDYLRLRLIRDPERPNPYTEPLLCAAVQDGYARLIAPAIEREIRSALTERAEDGAIAVFRENLSQLLMQPPITGQVVLGWDPAFRTGCKLAVVDPTGKVLDTTVIYPTEPQNRVTEAKAVLKKLIDRYRVTLISLGNGTASRESEQIIAAFLRELQSGPGTAEEKRVYAQLRYVIVNEAGASVYSASRLATEEFPHFDVGQRSAASMARRLQDPLAELVKIDPRSVGVGQYQHDMDQKKLGTALGGVVEACVNRVGVDLNTASFSLLSYISGISRTLAKNIVSCREEKGAFRSRRELLHVSGLGPKAFEQCAGFLRISGGTEPLDATSVHPENYSAVKKLLQGLGLSDEPSSFRMAKLLVKDRKREAERLGIGELTLADILGELEKPARDPREDMPAPVLRSDVLSMEDLRPGMELKGTVRNIVDFGAFVDIGVHQDGLVHISRISNRFIRHPLEAVHVGDVVTVTVVSVDAARKRIALSMNGKM